MESKNKIRTSLDYVLRFIFGSVFLFSGFVKTVDPMGTAYKIEEYMNVFGFQFLVDVAGWLPLMLSILLCVLEFMVGVMIFFHIYRKPSKIIAICFMVFFTITTLVDALTNKVTDCGCFGDAITLTNWQTFWKNIVLDVVLAGIVLFDSKKKEDYSRLAPCALLIVMLLGITVFAIRNIMYEPVIDFRPWKIGNKMAPTISEQQPPITYATYKNVQTGEEKEFSMAAEGENTLMAAYEKDPLFSEHWTYVDGKNRVMGTNTVAADGFSLTALESKDDESLEILGDTTSDLYMLAVWNMDLASDEGMKRAVKYLEKLSNTNANIILVTASVPGRWLEFQEKYDLGQYMFYSCDDKAIKAMIRSNPGIVHMSKTIVKEKFAWRNLPK